MNTRQVAMRDAFGEALLALGEKYPELVVLDADVSTSTRTSGFGKKHPDRFYNCGVAEANMIDIAAGMATCGLRPVASTFGLFIALKGADQIRNIISYNNLPVVLAGGYTGLSDSYDGASHQAVLDVSTMRSMPHMAVVVPGDGIEMAQALEAAIRRPGPTYIRITRNPSPVLFEGQPPLEIGKIRKLRDGGDLTIAVNGVPTYMAIEAAERLAGEGIAVDLLEVSSVKPMDKEALLASVRKTGRVLTVEEHTVMGGMGSAVAEVVSAEIPAIIRMIGLEDRFAESGDYLPLLAKYGFSTDNIAARARKLVESA